MKDGGELHLFNTHFNAFAHSRLMQKQVLETQKVVELSSAKHPCILGGDFNLLPPGTDLNDCPKTIPSSFSAGIATRSSLCFVLTKDSLSPKRATVRRGKHGQRTKCFFVSARSDG